MEVSKDVQDFVRTNFYAAQKLDISPDDSLLDNGIVDSTGVLELVSFLEGRYNVTVNDNEMVPENLDSIAAIVRFLQRKGVI